MALLHRRWDANALDADELPLDEVETNGPTDNKASQGRIKPEPDE